MSIKVTEFPVSCNERVADWYAENVSENHDIDPDMTFIDLYFAIVEGGDVFLACGEDNDTVRDCIDELEARIEDAECECPDLIDLYYGW